MARTERKRAEAVAYSPRRTRHRSKTKYRAGKRESVPPRGEDNLSPLSKPMSTKLSKAEFREIGFGQSYLARIGKLPQYFGDLFEMIAYAEGDFTRIDLRYANVSVDVAEKLGFVHQASDELHRLEREMKSLGVIRPGSSSQHVFSKRLSEAKYHVAMMIWSTRAVLDSLAVHLNETWSLEFAGKDIWLGAGKFRGALRLRRASLADALDPKQAWLSKVDEFRLYTIHREPLVVLPNGDPCSKKGWELTIAETPRHALLSLIRQDGLKLIPVLRMMSEWRHSAATVARAVFEDTIAAIRSGAAPTKVPNLEGSSDDGR